MRGYPHFSFWILITLAKIYFPPIVITFAKIHLYEEVPSLMKTNVQIFKLTWDFYNVVLIKQNVLAFKIPVGENKNVTWKLID